MAKKSLTPAEPATTTLVESSPGGWLKPTGAMSVAGPEFSRTAYVTFASAKGASFGKYMLSIPDLQDSDPVLVLPEPRLPVKLNPFRFFFPERAFQHWSIVDQSGAVEATTLDSEVARADRNYKEHVEACLLVVHEGKLVPARCTFKTTKTNAVHRAVDALKLASTPDWGKLSPAHEASLIAPVPWARFSATVRLKGGVGRASGYKYVSATSVITPSTVADWRMIGEFFADDANLDLIQRVEDAWKRRCDEIRSHVE